MGKSIEYRHMIKKVVFFRCLPLTRKIYSDFYIQEIQDAGFSVEYWYLPFVLSVPQGIEYYETDCVKVIESYNSLSKTLKSEDRKNTLFVSIQTYNGDVLRLFWIMTKKRCKLAVFGRNMIPLPKGDTEKHETKASKAIRFMSKFKSLSIAKIKRLVVNKLACYLKQWGIVKSYDVLFLSAETGIDAYGYKSNREIFSSKHVLVNGDDYDRALSMSNSKRLIDENFIVFIDTCLPLHPDIQVCNLKSMDPATYYYDLNAFFDKIESDTGLKIVIAAHPKALIYKNEDYFGGRTVIFGKTAELIRDSSLVLSHNSTSIGYAVFYEKPVILLVSNAMKESQRETYDSTLCFSKELNSTLICVDDYSKMGQGLKLENVLIDKDAYSRYKYRYLTNPKTENTLSYKLVIEGLKHL